MNELLIVYDNHATPNLFVKNIVGSKKFSDIILRRKSVWDKFENLIKEMSFVKNIIRFDNIWGQEEYLSEIRTASNAVIVHVFSHQIVEEEKKTAILFNKMCYIQEPVAVFQDGHPVMFAFPEAAAYCSFIENHLNNIDITDTFSATNFSIIKSHCFYNISIYANFIQYISGGFDARFFNSIENDDYTVTKKSANKTKIKAEYTFYHLLPDEMKSWFVLPYDYTENDTGASYKMERYHFTDLAIRWVHGAIDENEMHLLLKRALHFITTRKERPLSKQAYTEQAETLYVSKVKKRLSELKQLDKYQVIATFLKYGTPYENIDKIYDRYISLYHKLTASKKRPLKAVIGHGDFCFSNMLFNKDANLLKLIDPKGAGNEQDLWTDPYYDMAKLSHSICGRYDFFNNMLHRITVDDNLAFELHIDFDNKPYIGIFKKVCEANQFDFDLVRLYEASLFLSMLPLHMDKPQKVFGFLLNAIQIIESLEK